MAAARPVTVVMTVFNEADNIQTVLRSLLAQTRPPDEIVIVDGGSTDGTPAIIEKLTQEAALPGPTRLNWLVRPGANISQGRNAAILAAAHELIAVTDAGVRLDPAWLENLTAPFAQPGVEVVAGFFQADPDPTSPFQIALGATVLPVAAEIRPEKFLPSSRSVAFTRRAWQQAGGYPEWLDYCEDLIFDLNLKEKGFSFAWQPSALAHFAPRRSLKAFWLQYYRYARGDGKANLFFKRHLLRYATYGVVAPAGLAVAWRKPWVGLLLVGAGLVYLRQPYRRLFFHESGFKKLAPPARAAAILWVPVIRATGDFAKMCGYPPGRVWRRRRRWRSFPDLTV
jgi:glycosyltransferase involved in cell wall biosynthesis